MGARPDKRLRVKPFIGGVNFWGLTDFLWMCESGVEKEELNMRFCGWQAVIDLRALWRCQDAQVSRFVGFSALAVEVGPFARLNETRPVERMLLFPALQHVQLYSSQSLAASLPLPQACVVGNHHLSRHLI
jgi:hypothetical protein